MSPAKTPRPMPCLRTPTVRRARWPSRAIEEFERLKAAAPGAAQRDTHDRNAGPPGKAMPSKNDFLMIFCRTKPISPKPQAVNRLSGTCHEFGRPGTRRNRRRSALRDRCESVFLPNPPAPGLPGLTPA